MPTTEKKSGQNANLWLAFCPVGILSGWLFVLPPTNFQVPVRLHEKILELQDPVVGLAYIEELIPENDPEVHISDYCSHILGPHILLSFIHSLHQSSAFFYCGIFVKRMVVR